MSLFIFFTITALMSSFGAGAIAGYVYGAYVKAERRGQSELSPITDRIRTFPANQWRVRQ